LDEIDFEARPWIENSGWPISKRDLLPYYERSQLLLELKEFNYEVDHWSSAIDGQKAAFFPSREAAFAMSSTSSSAYPFRRRLSTAVEPSVECESVSIRE
jgi:hypothetical protein